jgi:nucleoside-diphosphate-sugar epimerase
VAKFLVTGGAGFIGSNLVDALVASGDIVRVVDDLSSGHRENLAAHSSRIEFVEGDILDRDVVSRAVGGVDYILHHAALVSVPLSVADPHRTHSVNIDATFNLLLAAREKGVKRFVFAASSAAYGESEIVPKTEDMAPAPASPYAVSKLVGEYYCTQFSRLGWLPCVSLRYFNIFGPRQDPASEYAAVVPIFITRLLGGEAPVIHGDGEQTRDFTYVDNAIRANLLAIEKERAVGGVFNVGCGESFTLKELYRRLGEVIGPVPEPVHTAPRLGDVRHSEASIERARSELGYEVGIGFSEGLRRTVDWFRRQRVETGGSVSR